MMDRPQNLSIVEGVNIIGILPGTRYQKAGDEIVLVGAHYDTVFNSNGVNDNGSGMVALLGWTPHAKDND